MPAIDSIQSGQAVQTLSQDQQKGQQAQQVPTPEQSKPVKDSVSVDIPPSTKSLGKLASVTQEMNQVAQQVRATDTALTESQSLVSQLKKELEKITKNFPPFPIDSTERKNILMSYSSIRKEILKLTIPPPPNPIYAQQPEMWKNLTSKDVTSTAVPDLPVTAQDKQVAVAQDALTSVGTTLQNGRDDLAKTSSL